MSHVNQTTGQVTCIGGLQRGIGKTLTGTVGRDKVLKHAQAFLKVSKNWVLDGLLTTFHTRLLRLSHQTTHTGELTDLVARTTSTRVKHHVHRVEALLIGRNLLDKELGKAVVDVGPNIDHLVVTLVVGDETHVVVVHHFFHLCVTFLNDVGLFSRHEHVGEVERQTALERHVVTHVLHIVEELSRTWHTTLADNRGDDFLQALLRDEFVDVTHFVRHEVVEQHTTKASVFHDA